VRTTQLSKSLSLYIRHVGEMPAKDARSLYVIVALASIIMASSFFLVRSFPVVVLELEPILVGFEIVLLICVIIPIVFGIDFLDRNLTPRLRSWRAKRKAPYPTPDGTFSWSGSLTSGFLSAGAVLGGGIIFVLILGQIEEDSGARGWLQASGWILLGLVVLLFATTLILRKKRLEYVVDDLGFRFSGRYWKDQKGHWQDMAQLEFSRMPRAMGMWMTKPEDLPLVLALRLKDGTIASILSPELELGECVGNALRQTLFGQAVRHKIPLVEVEWSVLSQWRRAKRDAIGDKVGTPIQ